jgi:proteic killer suppression protein
LENLQVHDIHFLCSGCGYLPGQYECASVALHPFKVGLEGHWAVRVSGNWRLKFAFEGENAILVDYQDYH